MSDNDKLTNENFSPELLHAISDNEIICGTDLPVLSPDDVAVLKQVLRGEIRPPILIDRKRAVTALAGSERSAEASEILARLVADAQETTQVRATAAAQLSLMPRESAEKALTENLETTNQIVRMVVRKSLAKIGSLKAVDDKIRTGVRPPKRYALPITTV